MEFAGKRVSLGGDGRIERYHAERRPFFDGGQPLSNRNGQCESFFRDKLRDLKQADGRDEYLAISLLSDEKRLGIGKRRITAYVVHELVRIKQDHARLPQSSRSRGRMGSLNS